MLNDGIEKKNQLKKEPKKQIESTCHAHDLDHKTEIIQKQLKKITKFNSLLVQFWRMRLKNEINKKIT
jgi:hypothetical protein